MNPTPTRSLLAALGAVAVCSLACTSFPGATRDEAPEGPAQICGKDAALVNQLSPASRDAVDAACMSAPTGDDGEPGEPVCDARAPACSATLTYGLVHLELDRWFAEHSDADAIGLYDGYIDAYLRPILDAHDALWSTQKILSAREALGEAPTILRVEGKDYSDAFLRKIRGAVKAVESDDERAILIDAYTNLKLLNALALTPRGELDRWRADVRAKLETHERLKARLEILELGPVDRPDTPEPTTGDPGADPAPGEDTPPPPPTDAVEDF